MASSRTDLARTEGMLESTKAYGCPPNCKKTIKQRRRKQKKKCSRSTWKRTKHCRKKH